MVDPIIRHIDPLAPSSSLVDHAVDVLEKGGLVVAPTETQYGLLTRADQAQPVKRLYQLKERSLNQPTAVFVGRIELMMHYARLNPLATRLARLFLPGPLTLVVSAIGTFPAGVVSEGKIGLRVSSSHVIQGIMQRVDFPVSATSANISGETTAARIDDIALLFGDAIGLYLDAGALEQQVSTVVDCSDERLIVLREGTVSLADLEAALKGTVQ